MRLKTTRKRSRLAPQEKAFLQHCQVDFGFWCKRLYRIRDKDRKLIPLVLNKAQLRLEHLETRLREQTVGRVLIYVLKGRQGGITTHQQAKSFYTIWNNEGTVCFTLADVDGNMRKIFEITHRAKENFHPMYLWKIGDSSKQEISFKNMDSFFWTGTAGSKRTGHSVTVDRVHGSEFAFWTDPNEVLGTITPSVVPRGGTIILETTADRFESPAHEFWQKTQNGETGYAPLFIPWWECDLENYRLPLLEPDELEPIDDEESDLMLRHGIDLEQINWRRENIRNLGKSEFLRQYAEDSESCWLSAGDSFYDADVLRKLYAKAPKPFHVVDVIVGEWSGKVRLYNDGLWQRDMAGRPVKYTGSERVVIGCDPAAGTGNDRSAWTARTFPSWKLLAEFGDEWIYPEWLADLLSDWGTKKLSMGNKPALQVIEKNGHGITILRRMRDVHRYPIEFLYRRVRLADRHAPKQPSMGWTTTAESKPLLLDAGRSILNAAIDGYIDPPTEYTIRDCFAVVQDENGKVELNSRDQLVGETLAWMGRLDIVKRQPKVLETVHW